jgi:hypothetical protein
VADHVEDLCEEAERVMGSLDGVIMPELALTNDDYEAVRERVLAKSLLLIAGVGRQAREHERGENYLCVDVPLSKHHAIHFRQDKQHRWRIDPAQIKTYNIGAGLDPSCSYWEDIWIGDRRLLFLVLRPWLVTSVLICEDLARHDPVGELLRGVGPHLVVALLMDGPQLDFRWSNRYATALADDPGSSVISVSSLGMVQLSRREPKDPPNRTVALWKDSDEARAKELLLPDGAEALALTVSVKYTTETTADARDCHNASAVPVLTGVHSIRRSSESIHRVDAKPGRIEFLAPHEASVLARLVQQDTLVDAGPTLLGTLTGEARSLGKEIWRQKLDQKPFATLGSREDFAELPTPEQIETAKRIIDWFNTNRQDEP